MRMKTWKKWQLGLGALLFFLIDQVIISYSMRLTSGWQVGLAAFLNLVLIALVIYWGGLLDFWNKKPAIWSGQGIKTIFLWSLYLFLTKFVAGIVLVLQQGIGANTYNQALLEGITVHPLLLFLVMVGVAPFAEEFLFRGLIMGQLTHSQSWLGLILSGFLFALGHVPTDFGSWLLYGGIGLTLALLYRRTQRLDYCIAIHFLNNLLGAFSLLMN